MGVKWSLIVALACVSLMMIMMELLTGVEVLWFTKSESVYVAVCV